MDPFVRAHPPRPPAWPTLAPTMDIVDSDDLNGLDPVFANPTLIHHPDRRRDHPLVLSRAASQQETAFWGDSHRTNVQRAPFFMQSEALQHQNQNQIHNPLLQITALRLAGITPQQFANMAPRQQEQLRQILESQLQQQALTQAYAQTRHLFQQEQPLPRLPQQHQGQLQFDSGQEQQRQSLRAQMLDFGPVRQWNGAGGNGGGDGGPVEALQNQNQNQNPNPLLQTAAPRLTGITPQQFANISAQQREQLRQFLETQQQQQQQALAQAQAQHQLQQQQQQQQRQQINQQPQLGQPDRPMQYHEFFTTTFNNWLAQRQLTLEPPRVDGKEVELHKLFLMVGALGGCRAVFEKRSWPLVGAKIGYPYFNGSMPYSKSEVGDQLSKVYQRLLADFEVHWHNSLRPRDPTSVFPLPPQLQYLHPEIERLAAATVPLPPLPVQQEKMQLQARL
ncbi:hypothetical protein FRC00_004649 [Tulasnella sp. 408]|nr:hypothetical protein FRC00_004649 [Tulasnella sp. 408]